MVSNEKEIFEIINSCDNGEEIRYIYQMINQYEIENPKAGKSKYVILSMRKSLYDKSCELFKRELNPNKFLN